MNEMNLSLHVTMAHRLSYRGPDQPPAPLLTSRAVVARPPLVIQPPLGSYCRRTAPAVSPSPCPTASGPVVAPVQIDQRAGNSSPVEPEP